jgi:hypothetical protein
MSSGVVRLFRLLLEDRGDTPHLARQAATGTTFFSPLGTTPKL